MVQFKIVSGKMAGAERAARHFPFRIGRAVSAHLQSEEDGVWSHHLELTFDAATGFVMTTCPNALAAVNGVPFSQVVLRNGDLVEIGALKLRFWLGDTHQSGLRLREGLTWAAFLLIFAVQFALIYWLTP